MIYRFGSFALDTRLLELRNRDATVPVEPQVFDLLAYLIEHRDHLVSRDELLDAIWQGRYVSDTALSSRIKSARVAIDDDGTRQRWIKTVHGRGFRFVGDVTVDDADQPGGSAEEAIVDTALRQDIRYCTTKDGVRLA